MRKKVDFYNVEIKYRKIINPDGLSSDSVTDVSKCFVLNAQRTRANKSSYFQKFHIVRCLLTVPLSCKYSHLALIVPGS